VRLAAAAGLAFIGLVGFAGAALASTGAIDVYVVVVLVGLLVLREALGAHAPASVRERIGVFVFLGVLAFVYIVVARIRAILNL